MKTKRDNPRQTLQMVRCAIYTRKSTEEGLEQEFNSLDAQREAAEAFVASQRHEGWHCLPDRYDDGGFTGGNTERPGLRRLMEDIEAGKIDCVVVYKVDRLSRSLLDFSGLMQVFDKQRVSFVSVTQQFNTATSMGRLILNVLLSFAQFEREIISERTRDKIAATRRKGKWSGGNPLLGFDVDPNGFKLRVNEEEAERVRTIFAMYLEEGSMLPVVRQLAERDWKTKRWETRKGKTKGGNAFTRTNLHRLLTNVAYLGKVKYKDELYEGEHPAIVDPGVFDRVQKLLQRNGRMGGAPLRNKFGSLLKGLLRCVPCNCSMSPSHTNKGNKLYRYYLCNNAQKRGWDTCPSKSIPAAQIEELVVSQIKRIGQDESLLQEVLAQARQQDEARTKELEREQRGLQKDLASWHSEVRTLSCQIRPGEENNSIISRLADLQERIGLVEGRVRKIREQIQQIRHQLLDQDEAAEVMGIFDPLWDSLTPNEKARIMELLVERIDYDGEKGKVSIAFHPTGIKTLANELADQTQGKIA